MKPLEKALLSCISFLLTTIIFMLSNSKQGTEDASGPSPRSGEMPRSIPETDTLINTMDKVTYHGVTSKDQKFSINATKIDATKIAQQLDQLHLKGINSTLSLTPEITLSFVANEAQLNLGSHIMKIHGDVMAKGCIKRAFHPLCTSSYSLDAESIVINYPETSIILSQNVNFNAEHVSIHSERALFKGEAKTIEFENNVKFLYRM